MNISKFQFFIIAFAACFLAGCMHYETGSSSQIPFSTIYIEPIKNDALVHHVRATFGAQVREKIAEHPGITLVNSPESADVCLKIKIKDFDQSIATTMSDDTSHAKSFSLEMVAECSLYDNRTQKYLFHGCIVSAAINSRADENYLWNKTKMMPQLSEKLADKIYDIVCKPW